MKTWTIVFLAAWLIACGDCSMPVPEHEKGTVAPAEAKSLEANVPTFKAPESAAPATVIFQGLMAFATKDATEKFPITALFVDADRRPPGAGELPNVVCRDAVTINDFFLPPHEPYIAFENAEINQDCNLQIGEPKSLYLYVFETNSYQSLEGYLLCGISGCEPKEIVLQLGQSSQMPEHVDLEGLVDRDDLLSGCPDDFFKIQQSVNDEISASIRIESAKAVVARSVPRRNGTIPVFGYRMLQGNLELPDDTCSVSPRGPQTFAEEVAVSGDLPIILKLNGRTCTISAREEQKPVRTWLFNINPEAYNPNHEPDSHHEAFYWFYDFAPAACGGSGDRKKYLRPCEINPPAGYPKCPLALLEGV